jgi:hypothetical protein
MKPFQRPSSFVAWSFESLNYKTKNEWSFIQGHRYNQKRRASKEKKGGYTVQGTRCTPNAKTRQDKSNHESTKIGKHEKGPIFLYNPLFFRAFVPRQINGGQASCFRDELLAFLFGPGSCAAADG